MNLFHRDQIGLLGILPSLQMTGLFAHLWALLLLVTNTFAVLGLLFLPFALMRKIPLVNFNSRFLPFLAPIV